MMADFLEWDKTRPDRDVIETESLAKQVRDHADGLEQQGHIWRATNVRKAAGTIELFGILETDELPGAEVGGGLIGELRFVSAYEIGEETRARDKELMWRAAAALRAASDGENVT